jgi:hypothetical protein
MCFCAPPKFEIQKFVIVEIKVDIRPQSALDLSRFHDNHAMWSCLSFPKETSILAD